MAMRASFPKKDSNRVTSHARGADRAFTFHLLQETVNGLLTCSRILKPSISSFTPMANRPAGDLAKVLPANSPFFGTC
jgi:hypothetical protein